MDAQTIGTATAVVVPLILGFTWLLRLEGRVNTGEVIQAELKEDVRYIRDRIDRALQWRGPMG